MLKATYSLVDLVAMLGHNLARVKHLWPVVVLPSNLCALCDFLKLLRGFVLFELGL